MFIRKAWTGTYTVIIKQLTPQSNGQVTKFSWGWR